MGERMEQMHAFKCLIDCLSSFLGDVVKVAIKDAKGDKVQAGMMKKAVIVETKYPSQRKNGSHVQYLKNSCVLLSEKGTPLGSRIKAVMGHESYKPRWRKLALLAKVVL
jgi:ribosomal protein L14